MTIEKLHIENWPRLVLIFAGWGMDGCMFKSLHRRGYDVAVVHSYHTDEPIPDWIDAYQEICVLAWSYGVSMAERVLNRYPHWPVTLKVAVNGTPMPVSDTLGIPESIYQGTLLGLCERSVYKFYRRMCIDADEFGRWKMCMPHRTVDSLVEELEMFGRLTPVASVGWDIVFIGLSDAIIPVENQRAAWASIEDIRELECGHLPDFQHLLDTVLIDKTDVEKKFSTHADTYCSNATVQREMCEHVDELLHEHIPAKVGRMVEVGAGTGLLTRMYAQWVCREYLELWDLSLIDPLLPGEHRICDAELAVNQLENVDVIVSSATIQWMNNPKRFVERCAAALAPGGVAVIATFGPSTFQEIAPMLPKALRYPTIDEWRELKLPDCDIVVDESITRLTFSSSRELLRHISLTGVNGCGVSGGASQRACRAILGSHIDTLTYSSVYITLRKRA